MAQGSPEVVRKVGGSVSPPMVLSQVYPEFTDEARLAAVSGSVLVSLEVAEDGTQQNVQVSAGWGMAWMRRRWKR